MHHPGRIGYRCIYCTEEFVEPAKLKAHTLEAHADETNPLKDFFKTVTLAEMKIRVDITGLRCLLCREHIDTLEEIMHHLANEHNKTIHTDIKNYIIPFKFNTEQLTCYICSDVFDKFKMLQEHMHKHYSNFVCDACGSGYVNKESLSRHEGIHKKGAFPCSVCPKVCDTIVSRRTHIRSAHTHVNSRMRCGYCNEGFREQHEKDRHLITVHGIIKKSSKCNACDRYFSTVKHLKAHIKKDHLLERRHKCTECDMSFYSTPELSNHMLKHTGEKKYQCDVCSKWYGRKYTLREHIRIHINDRRFKCERCSQSFVQKCSWRSHMKSKHGENV